MVYYTSMDDRFPSIHNEAVRGGFLAGGDSQRSIFGGGYHGTGGGFVVYHTAF